MQLEEFRLKVFPLKDKVFRFAKWILNNSQDAEDMVQEVLEKLWVSRTKLESLNNIEAYTLRITKNACLNKLNRHKKLGQISRKMAIPEIHTPHDKTEYNDLKNIMKQIIAGLPENQRMIVELKSVEGLSIQEIADVMEISDNNARVILSRARKQIKDAFDKIYRNEN